MSTAQSSTITSRPSRVEFTNRFVQPPGQLYVFRDDRLFIHSQSVTASLRVNLRGRLLTPTGEIITVDFPHVTSGDSRGEEFETFDIREGFLLGLALTTTTLFITRGAAYFAVGLARGRVGPAAAAQVLFADYIDSRKSPSWPVSDLHSSLSGAGRLHPPAGAVPATANETTFSFPAGARARVITMTFTLTTDANVSNRLVKIEVVTDSRRVLLSAADIVQPASTTVQYTAGGFGGSASALGGAVIIPLPENLILGRNDIIRTVTDGGQIGDAYSAPQLYVEEWLEGVN